MGYDINSNSLKAPLSTWSVAKCIMASSGDVVTLCRSANINPKSMYKPIRYPLNTEVDNHPQELLPDDFTDCNYGIKLRTGYSDLSQLATAIANSLAQGFKVADESKDVWAFYYDAPREGDMCRLTDFDQYKHYPTDWVQIEFENQGNTAENNTKFRLWFREALANGIADIKSWEASSQFFDGTVNFIGTLCLLVCTKTNEAYTAKYLLPILKGEDWNQSEDINPIFSAQFSGVDAGSYFVYPIITDARNLTVNQAYAYNAEQLAEAKFLPFPYASFTSWKPVASGTPEGGNPPIANTIDIAFDTKEGDGYAVRMVDTGYYVVDSFDIVFSLSSPLNKATAINYRIYLGNDTKYNTNALLAQGTATIPINETDAMVAYTRPEKEEENQYTFFIESNPTLWVVYNATGYTSSEKALQMY